MGQIQRDGKANGVSTQVRFAITQGKAPSFFVIDGYDIMMVLSEANNAIGGRREKALVHSGGKPARELVRSTR
jgi:hypothetical protein